MLGLLELVRRVGEDNIRIQNLLECATNLRTRKGGYCEVAFLTKEITPNAGIGRADRLGLVVWFPMADIEKINRELADGTPTPRGETT